MKSKNSGDLINRPRIVVLECPDCMHIFSGLRLTDEWAKIPDHQILGYPLTKCKGSSTKWVLRRFKEVN